MSSLGKCRPILNFAGSCAHRRILYRSAVLASFLLNEELGHIGRVGCTLCLLGSLIIVLHAPEDKDIQTVDEILHYAVQPGACIVPVPLYLVSLPRRLPSVPPHGPNIFTCHDLSCRT